MNQKRLLVFRESVTAGSTWSFMNAKHNFLVARFWKNSSVVGPEPLNASRFVLTNPYFNTS